MIISFIYFCLYPWHNQISVDDNDDELTSDSIDGSDERAESTDDTERDDDDPTDEKKKELSFL